MLRFLTFACGHLTATPCLVRPQVLDLRMAADGSGPTNLRFANFSRNCLDMLRDLSAYSRLTQLSVVNNRIERLGSDLKGLGLLKVRDGDSK